MCFHSFVLWSHQILIRLLGEWSIFNGLAPSTFLSLKQWECTHKLYSYFFQSAFSCFLPSSTLYIYTLLSVFNKFYSIYCRICSQQSLIKLFKSYKKNKEKKKKTLMEWFQQTFLLKELDQAYLLQFFFLNARKTREREEKKNEFIYIVYIIFLKRF